MNGIFNVYLLFFTSLEKFSSRDPVSFFAALVEGVPSFAMVVV